MTRRAPRPYDEVERLAALRAYEILDTPPEPAFDALVELASEICGVPFALITLVDDERQWFKAKVGFEIAETDRESSFCAHAICHGGIFAVDDARQDPRFADNPFVVGEPRVRFYASAPLTTPKGQNVGSLCIIDRVPRQLTEMQARALSTLSAQVAAQLELRAALRRSRQQEAALRAQRDELERVQKEKHELSSLVVHDLKNPLSAVLTNAHFIAGTQSVDDAQDAAQDIVSSAEAMQRMVMNLLDISSGERNGLAPLFREVRVGELLSQICRAEHRLCAASGRRLTVVDEVGDLEVMADAVLLRRVVENLVDNARKYGDGPIRVCAREDGPDAIRISVSDEGHGVDAGERARIFDLHTRAECDAETAPRDSHGLGLAFCRLAVAAHGGELWVEDNLPKGSAFCVRLPRGHTQSVGLERPTSTIVP